MLLHLTVIAQETNSCASIAQVFAPIAFVTSLVGVTVIGYLVRRSGRASIIIILMVRCGCPVIIVCRLRIGTACAGLLRRRDETPVTQF